MRVLIWSRFGDASFLAWRAHLDGHEVEFFPGKADGVLSEIDGIEIVQGRGNLNRAVANSDIVIFDMVGLGSIGSRLMEFGKPVITGGEIGDELELNRLKAMKLFEKLGIAPKYRGFRSYRDAAQFVTRNGGRWVFKPLGNKATTHTYVAMLPDSSDLVRFVSRWAEKEDGPCVLQEFVDGVEVSTEGWFDGEKFVPPFNHTIERKRFMEGDKGPNTGAMGNIVWFCSEEDPIVRKVLLPLADLLRGKYCGPIDVNCIVNSSGIYGLEFTCRFGYPALQALLEMVGGDFVEHLKLFSVRALKKFRVRNASFGGAVRMSLPPWPVTQVGVKELKGVVPVVVPKEGWKHFHPADVSDIKDNGEVVMAGVDGVVGESSARGSTVREVARRVYRQINSWRATMDLQYRGDIFNGIVDKLEELNSLGVEVPNA